MVLDASALLALMMGEPGAETVEAAVGAGAVMSSVNVAEVITKFVERDMLAGPKALRAIQEIGIEIIPYDAEQALVTGALRFLTKECGLSLGDRACLALGKIRNVPVLTADSVWQKVQHGALVDIVLIR